MYLEHEYKTKRKILQILHLEMQSELIKCYSSKEIITRPKTKKTIKTIITETDSKDRTQMYCRKHQLTGLPVT